MGETKWCRVDCMLATFACWSRLLVCKGQLGRACWTVDGCTGWLRLSSVRAGDVLGRAGTWACRPRCELELQHGVGHGRAKLLCMFVCRGIRGKEEKSRSVAWAQLPHAGREERTSGLAQLLPAVGRVCWAFVGLISSLFAQACLGLDLGFNLAEIFGLKSGLWRRATGPQKKFLGLGP